MRNLAPGWYRSTHRCCFGYICLIILSCNPHISILTIKITWKALQIKVYFVLNQMFLYMSWVVCHVVSRQQLVFYLLFQSLWFGSYCSLMYVLMNSVFERALCKHVSFIIYFSLTIFFLSFLPPNIFMYYMFKNMRKRCV